MMLKPALRPPMRAPMRSANSPREGVGVYVPAGFVLRLRDDGSYVVNDDGSYSIVEAI